MPYFVALLKRVHLIIGLAGGGFFAVLGLTGAALAFRPSIEAALYWPKVAPAVVAGSAWEQSATLAASRFPGKKLREANIKPGYAWEFVLHDRNGLAPVSLYIDPAAGKELGSRIHAESFLHTIHQLHANLLLGPFGLQIVSRMALLLMLQVSVGVLLWRMHAYPLHGHAWLGLTAGVLAALLAYSGWRMLTVRVASITPVVTLRGVENKAPLDQLVETAQKRRPGGVLRSIYFPQAPSQPLQFWFGERPSDGIVYMDPYGAILPVMIPPANNGAADWHRGPGGGLAGRLLRLLAGAGVALSFVTGILRYWSGRKA